MSCRAGSPSGALGAAETAATDRPQSGYAEQEPAGSASVQVSVSLPRAVRLSCDSHSQTLGPLVTQFGRVGPCQASTIHLLALDLDRTPRMEMLVRLRNARALTMKRPQARHVREDVSVLATELVPITVWELQAICTLGELDKEAARLL